jgi:iron complex outermembrane recepter protein
MKTKLIKLCCLGVFFLMMHQTTAQDISLSGKVFDDKSNEPLVGVNVQVKGRYIGSISDNNGNFQFNIKADSPFTLVFSSIGYATRSIDIEPDSKHDDIRISLTERSLMADEIVISASRIEESILQSPVSIEKMGIIDIREAPSFSYYQQIANLKSIDVATSSIGFQVYNVRGFYTTGNERIVQMIDGMDSQAPGLNFPISNLNGPSELDIESIEFIPGAASALYGPNAFNGVILMRSKDPFQYPGLSINLKRGINHVNSISSSVKPLYQGDIRYAKAFNNKFAFKLNLSYFTAEDWHATDMTDLNLNNKGNLSVNPGYDGLHTYGDEAGVNMALLRTNPLIRDGLAGVLFQSNPAMFGGEFSNAQNFASQYTTNLPVIQVNRTPYEEKYLVDYDAKNLKANAALHYRFNDRWETSYTFNYGSGTSVYSGTNRYSLQDFYIHQHKIELKAPQFLFRGYTTQERSGSSYDATFAALNINNEWKDNNTWFGTYAVAYAAGLVQETGANPTLVNQIPANVLSQLHLKAREQADQGRFMPDSPEFNDSFAKWKSEVIPIGARFNDKTNLYHLETQYDLRQIKIVDVIAGANYRLYDLNSDGTIFPDTVGNELSIYELGSYVQASKRFAGDHLKITGSIRYDKNQNFDAQFSPRISAVLSQRPNHHIRASYQTGFRIPSTQEQHIDLNVGAFRLLGGLPIYADHYRVTENTYTSTSIDEFSKTVFSGEPDLSKLERFEKLDKIKPEKIQTFEIGYKSLINNTLYLDFSYYRSRYRDFIGQVRVRRAAAPIPAGPTGFPIALSLLNPSAETYQIYLNSDKIIKAHGLGIGLDYLLPGGFKLGGNYNYNTLVSETDEEFVAAFNTPEHKVNLHFGNRNILPNLGFNLIWRWQDAFAWEASFAMGDVPAFQTLDAKISYKLPPIKSILSVGGSNVLNNWHIQNYGGPSIGGVFYVSLTFDELLN